LREATEGRVTTMQNLEAKIDYAAGQTAQEQLLSKLIGLVILSVDLSKKRTRRTMLFH
jgi:hypothetical protein